MSLAERAKIGFKKKEIQAPVLPAGRLVTRPSDGIVEARDAHGRLLAHFNPKTNETRDTRGELVGLGNRLPKILHEASATRPGKVSLD